ncbi:MAG: hypothetical protein Q8Q59_08405 [Luteolibacter sp.]|jgi:hypothetical protein|nr:hypothetical protein [Luteolibacter sp.]
MIPQTYVRLSSPVTVDLRIALGPRPRVIPAGPVQIPDAEHEPVTHTFDLLPLVIMLDAQAREIAVQLPPIPGRLRIYGPEDFAAAASDLPPLPPRVPREIPNWRAKAVLATMGQLTAVEAAIQAMPEPERTIVSLAWGGDAKLARSGKTVLMLAPMLGLSSAEVDALFIAAEAIEV